MSGTGDVLIRGMEVPTNCYKCPMRRRDGMDIVCPIAHERFSIADVNILEYRLKNCPLVPIPKHGRLVDADKMRESIRRQAGFLKLMGGKMAEIAETLEKGFLQEIDNAPTVIPAEEAKE